jgi:hypothetical protein
MFGFLKKDPFGDELTFGYMYENSGSHGFLHTPFGEHTESVGVMKNFPLPATKRLTGYTWIETGITSFTGNARLQNRLDSSLSLGAIVHFSRHSSAWIQESYGKSCNGPVVHNLKHRLRVELVTRFTINARCRYLQQIW